MVQQLNGLLSVTQLATDEREKEDVFSQNRVTIKKSPGHARSGGSILQLNEVKFPASALARLPAGQTPDNLLKSAIQSQDVTVTLIAPPDLYPGDTIELQVDGAPGTPIDAGSFQEGDIIPLVLPASLRTEGHHSLQAVVTYDLTGDQEFSPPLPFIVDLTPPGSPFLGTLKIDSAIIRDGLTPDKLESDGQGNEYLEAQVPGYSGQAAGDVISPVMNGLVAGGAFLVEAADVGKDIAIHFLREFIESVGDGDIEFTYIVGDRAGNYSRPADPVMIKVLLAGTIDDLDAPEIPSSADGIIDESDARQPLDVIIPGNASILPGDSITLKWGNTELNTVAVPPGGEGDDPLMTLSVPYATVYSEWKRLSGGSDQLTTLDVSYSVLRSGLPAGESPATAVSVNLFQPGGDPDPDKPEHARLLAPSVQSDTGPVNTIPVEDDGKDARVIIPWYNNESPAKEVFIAGDDILVYYGTTSLPVHTVSSAEAGTKADLELTLPASVITGEGSGELEIWYTVSRAVQGGGVNTVLSPLQVVTVVGKDTLPGGQNGLTEGDFLPVNARGVIGKTEAAAGVKFWIPQYVNQATGDRIVLTFALALGTAAAHASGEAPIAGTELTLSKTVGPDDLAGDIGIDIPGNILMLPLRVTHTHASYTIANSFGTVTAPERYVTVDSRGAGG